MNGVLGYWRAATMTVQALPRLDPHSVASCHRPFLPVLRLRRVIGITVPLCLYRPHGRFLSVKYQLYVSCTREWALTSTRSEQLILMEIVSVVSRTGARRRVSRLCGAIKDRKRTRYPGSHLNVSVSILCVIHSQFCTRTINTRM